MIAPGSPFRSTTDWTPLSVILSHLRRFLLLSHLCLYLFLSICPKDILPWCVCVCVCVLVLTTVPPATALPKYWQPNLISLPSLSFSPLSSLTLSGLGCYPFLWASDNIPSSQVSLSVSPPFSLFVCRFSLLSLPLFPPSLFADYGCVRCCKDAASLCQFHIETVVIFYCRTEVTDAFVDVPTWSLFLSIILSYWLRCVCVNVSYVFVTCFPNHHPRSQNIELYTFLSYIASAVFFFLVYMAVSVICVCVCVDMSRHSQTVILSGIYTFTQFRCAHWKDTLSPLIETL